MKYFMVCTNPNCERAFHEVNEAYLSKALESGIPVVKSLTGEMPPAEVASMIISDFLENAPEDQIEDMATEKEETSNEIGEGHVEPTVAPVEDMYYQSEEYKEHRTRMIALEEERLKADIESIQAQTELTKAKARKLNAEARILEEDSSIKYGSGGKTQEAKPTK